MKKIERQFVKLLDTFLVLKSYKHGTKVLENELKIANEISISLCTQGFDESLKYLYAIMNQYD